MTGAGKLIVYEARGSVGDPPLIENVDAARRWSGVEGLLGKVRAHVGDDLEAVPYFDTLVMSGTKTGCVALCGENGKANRLPINRRATMLWRAALAANPDLSSMARHLFADDVLVGTVVVLTGDVDFLGGL